MPAGRRPKVQTQANRRCSVPSLPNLPPCNLGSTTTCQPQDDREPPGVDLSQLTALSAISSLTLPRSPRPCPFIFGPLLASPSSAPCPAALCARSSRIPKHHHAGTSRRLVLAIALGPRHLAPAILLEPVDEPVDEQPFDEQPWAREKTTGRPAHLFNPTWPVPADQIPSRWRTYASLSDVLTTPDGRASATAPLEIPQRFELPVATACPSAYTVVPIHTILPHTQQQCQQHQQQ